MKQRNEASRGRTRTHAAAASAAAVVLVGLWFGAGCGKSEGPVTESGTASVPPQGEPIRGEAIQAPQPTTQEAAANEGSAAKSAAGTNTAAATDAGSAPVVGSGTAASPLSVGFDRLASFQYTLPEGPVDTNTVAKVQASAQIPVTIQSLNNQFVSLKGFMLPLKVEKGLVTELLIMRDQSMCCYGTVPKINEWVSVKMVGGGVKPIMDQAVTLFGRLKVGEMYENGYLVGIYAMDGERMAGPLDM